MPDTW